VQEVLEILQDCLEHLVAVQEDNLKLEVRLLQIAIQQGKDILEEILKDLHTVHRVEVEVLEVLEVLEQVQLLVVEEMGVLVFSCHRFSVIQYLQ
jgi:hypothetical protein